MKARILCFACLLFILSQGILLIREGGESLGEIPASSVFYEKKDSSLLIEGQVYKKTYTSNIQVLYLKNKSVNAERFIIYNQNFKNISIGEKMLIRGTLEPFGRARNPGGYDEALYYARQHIYGVVWCAEILKISGEENVILERLSQLKSSWKQELTEYMGEKNGGILAAMLLGEKGEMDAEVKTLYQENGISHILAISGLHISFIGLGVYRLLRKTGLGFSGSGVLAMCILTLYVLMIGLSVSVVRAYIMLFLRIGADITGRVYDMLTAAMLGAAVTVGYEPLFLTDGGFYMSYGAIIAIALLLPALEKCFPCKKKWLSGGYASIAINILLFPITLWYFYVVPTYSVFINLVVLPLTGPVLGIGIFGSFLLLFFPSAGGLCLKACGLILKLFECICKLGKQLPASQLVLGKPDVWKIMLYYGVLLFLIWFVGFMRKKNISFKNYISRVIWLCLLIPILLMAHRPRGLLDVVMLDVGQGDCMYLRSPNGITCMIDGGSSDEQGLAQYFIEPFLKSYGTGELDYVFVTHGDSDHYSGIEEMLERQSEGILIRNLVLPANYKSDKVLVALAEKAQKQAVSVSVMESGQSLMEKNFSIKCLQPSANEKELTGNEGSMILEVRYKEFSMLCTGDVEGVGEKKLQNIISGKRYHVLKVAHHGSANSTSKEFLQQTLPAIALVSAGKNNPYGHPHAELLERLKAVKCKIYQTQEKGAIILQTDGISLTIR